MSPQFGLQADVWRRRRGVLNGFTARATPPSTLFFLETIGQVKCNMEHADGDPCLSSSSDGMRCGREGQGRRTFMHHRVQFRDWSWVAPHASHARYFLTDGERTLPWLPVVVWRDATCMGEATFAPARGRHFLRGLEPCCRFSAAAASHTGQVLMKFIRCCKRCRSHSAASFRDLVWRWVLFVLHFDACMGLFGIVSRTRLALFPKDH